MTKNNGERSGDEDDVIEHRKCEGPTCHKTVRVSVGKRGGRPRRFCSDACRMQRQRADKVKANAVTGGGVEIAERQLVVQLDAEEGSMAAALGALAISAAQMADAGNPMAPGHLSKILDALDEAAPERNDTDKFSLLWDVVLAHPRAITREGVNPESKLGRALLERGERGEVLPTKFPPPWYPPGWSGTAISGSPEEYAQRIGWPWHDPMPLRFWTRDQLECPECGHEFLPPSYEAEQAEHRQLQRAEIERHRRTTRPPGSENKRTPLWR